jgi:hypothetical protein
MNTPVGPDRDRPKPFQVTFERVQMITGQAEFPRRCRIIEYRQYLLNRVHHVRPYPAAVVAFKEPFQAAIPEASDNP